MSAPAKSVATTTAPPTFFRATVWLVALVPPSEYGSVLRVCRLKSICVCCPKAAAANHNAILDTRLLMSLFCPPVAR
jgi:hypothetical protein